MRLFTNDPGAVAAGVDYLRTVAPAYGFSGIALLLYFASQGAGRLLWPVLGNIARLTVAGRVPTHTRASNTSAGCIGPSN